MNSLIRWFVRNAVAANMLMVLLISAGALGVWQVNNQFIPNISPAAVHVVVPYPGAGPSEVEEQICLRVEQAVSSMDGIKRIRCKASYGVATTTVEASTGWPVTRLLADVKNRVDAISTLPRDAERPLVYELTIKFETDQVVVWGDVSESELKVIGEEVRREMSQLKGVSSVSTFGTRPWELSIEVAPAMLLAHNLTIEQITQAVRNHSLNLPAGEIKQQNATIQLQVYGQAYDGEGFASIPIISREDGTNLLLGDIAEINLGFEDSPIDLQFNGQRVLLLMTYASENPDFIAISKRINRYLEQKQSALPTGVNIGLLLSNTDNLNQRLDLLARNALQGLVLVFIILMLFLTPKLAGWVVIGLFTAYMGTFALMSAFDVSLSMISAFAFLLILGIVVDDAIIIGESIHAHQERMDSPIEAAEQGAARVAKPVLFAVATTMAVFLPGAMITANIGQILSALSMVAIFALLMSLVESLLILPCHLAYLKPETAPRNRLTKGLRRARLYCTGKLDDFSKQHYSGWLSYQLANPFMCFAVFIATLLIAFSLLIGGWTNTNFIPRVPGDFVQLTITPKQGLSDERKSEIGQQVHRRTNQLRQDSAMRPNGVDVVKDHGVFVNDNEIVSWLFLTPDAERPIDSNKVLALWRDYLGEFPHANSVNLTNDITQGDNDKDLVLSLTAADAQMLSAATAALQAMLSNFPGVLEVSSSEELGGREIDIQLKPLADTLGVDLADLARQVRSGFYGQEAQKIPDSQEEIRVMVRYPEEYRNRIDTLETMWINTGTTSTPLSQLADIGFGNSSTSIAREDRQRVLKVSANINSDVVSTDEIVEQILRTEWPKVEAQFPGVSVEPGRRLKEARSAAGELISGLLLVLLAIYTLFAIEFKSYVQPVLVLSAIPFGLAGSIVAHLLFGYDFSLPSVLGLLATAGVVINDNLVLIDDINQRRANAVPLEDAVKQGAHSRLRPILLTTATTFIGLLPILSEPSFQAQFIKPMATSLAFGVLVSTPVTLLLTPVLYKVVEGFKERRLTKSTTQAV